MMTLLDKNKLKQLKTETPFLSLFSYLKVYAGIFSVFVINHYYPLIERPLMLLLALIWIAGRQHSLYVLNHDATHQALFNTRKYNKWVATLLSNWVMFHHPESWSYVMWRRIHLCHHRYLFTDHDPNYVGRIASNDTHEKMTLIKLVKKCLQSPIYTITNFFIGKQDYCFPRSQRWHRRYINHLKTLFFSFTHDPEMEQERRWKWVFFSSSIILLTYFNAWTPFLLLWILPMYTIYPMILTFFDLTEHYWEIKSQNIFQNTHSIERSFLSRIVLTLLHRGLHREHHLFPTICAARLPLLKKLLD